MSKNFTWKPFFHELFVKIVSEYDPKSLAKIAYEIFPEKGLMDRDINNNEFRLKEFEPCTFMARFNRKEREETKIEYCKKAKKILELSSEVPEDFNGIPIFQNMAFWFTPWGYLQKGFEVDALWKLSAELVNGEVSEKTFNAAYKSKGAGLSYLTTICFIVNPDKYLPLDKRTTKFLGNIETPLEDQIDNIRNLEEPFGEYKKLLNDVSKILPGKSCADISLSAYLEDIGDEADNASDVSYWAVGAMWGDDDKSAEFIKSGKWVNGYEPDSGDKSIEKVKLVKAGDWIAIKSAFTKERKISTIRIKAVGIVTKNYQDGRHLDIDWKYTGPQFDLEGVTYMQTIHEITDKEDQRLIFNNSYKSVRKDFSSLSSKDKRSSDDEGIEFMNKNLIIWGPPGTGKTRELLQMQTRFVGTSKKKSKDLNTSEFISDLSWWETIAVALIEIEEPVSVAELLEHKFIKEKILQSKLNKARPNNVLWSNLQNHATSDSKTVNVNIEKRQEPLIFDKTDDSKWFLSNNWKVQIADLISDLEKFKNGQKKSDNEKRYEMVTFHQSYGYEEFVEGFRPQLTNDGSGMIYQLQDGIFKQICKRALMNPDEEYAIFIDEINRGNLSKIFGELITLIEIDKRSSGPNNGVRIRLPYSSEEFGVPPNLFIVGTMNSVDRSIALVDMALRRRFEFKSLRPNSSLIEANKIEEFNLKNIFESLNNKIAVILGNEYQIGHSYFMNENVASLKSFKKTWFGGILPLLQEYLFDDWTKLKALVGDFVEESKPIKFLSDISLPKDTFGSFKNENLSDDEFIRLMKQLE